MTLEEFEELKLLDKRILTGPVLLDDARRYIELDILFNKLSPVEKSKLKQSYRKLEL